jgi:putative selenate reductase
MEHIAPDFRITKEAINKDMELIRKSGAKFRLGVDGNFSIDSLKSEGFKYIFIAIGAWKPGTLQLYSCDGEIINVLDFLENYNKARELLRIGRNVAVIGAGNSAMDAARSAKRVAGVDHVYVVYRRTKKYMPADREELLLALEDGIEFKELLAPISFNLGVLHCQKMELGSPDASGRRSPVPVSGEFVDLTVDTVIAAVGEKVENELLTKNGIALDEKGRIKVNPETNETSITNVFIGGDALRGPATIVEGIADGTAFAKTVIAKQGERKLSLEKAVDFDKEKQMDEIMAKKGVLRNTCNPGEESDRCLECSYICNICVEVCPNRANFAVKVNNGNLKCRNQVIHIDGMCNECGNCQAFCPYDSEPYRDKFTLYWSVEDFEDSKNAGFVLVDESSLKFRVRLGENTSDVIFDKRGKCDKPIPEEVAGIILAVYKDYKYLLK